MMLISDIMFTKNGTKPTMATFLNLAKVFEIINLDILLDKVNKIGIEGTRNNLIRNYLTNSSKNK